jgi:glycosyltransferase involved in cell wall biosynthesis
MAKEFVVLGADRADRIAATRARLGGTWLEHDFESRPLIVSERHAVERSVVVCNDLLARPFARENVLRTLVDTVSRGATAIVTAPAAEAGLRGGLRASEMLAMLAEAGLAPTFFGRTATDDVRFEKATLLAIVEPDALRPQVWRTPPDDFTVVAIITAFNEADVIERTIEHLISQGVQTYLMDNWSNDDTVRLASKYLGRGVVAIERNPLQDTASYDLEKVLSRMEHLSQALDADWFIDYDADEIRRSAFRGVGLRDALYAVDRLGYNAVDFTVMNYRPTDESFVPGSSLEAHFRGFEWGKTPDHLRQRKGWKNLGKPVFLLERAGHDVLFRDRNLYPYKFMNKHYPVRSQAHGERKVVKERRERFNRRERDLRKWHVHYDEWPVAPNFLYDPSALVHDDPATFHENYFVERLTGIGSSRAPDYLEMYLNHHGESV